MRHRSEECPLKEPRATRYVKAVMNTDPCLYTLLIRPIFVTPPMNLLVLAGNKVG